MIFPSPSIAGQSVSRASRFNFVLPLQDNAAAPVRLAPSIPPYSKDNLLTGKEAETRAMEIAGNAWKTPQNMQIVFRPKSLGEMLIPLPVNEQYHSLLDRVSDKTTKIMGVYKYTNQDKHEKEFIIAMDDAEIKSEDDRKTLFSQFIQV